MSMKAILVPLEQNDYTQSVLTCATLFAGRFGGHIQGFAFFPMYEVYGFGDMTPLWITEGRPSEELAGEARKIFDRFMRQERPASATDTSPISFSWLTESDPGDIFVASHARVFDITVLGRPGYDPSGPRSSTLEAVLFESGRPCLIAPPTPPRELGDNILIAWNRSTETALAVAHAMPLLHAAKRVSVLTVEGGSVPGPSGEQLAAGLKLNGIEATAVSVNPGKRTSGETILDHASAIGADLLIKGAYTQSRLRQMIFGGATSHILAKATLPVFMAR
jgi:nucleotide-binding universal stress UspA family protein